MMKPDDWLSEAKRYDVRFDGMQKLLNGVERPMFTHQSYGTFIVLEHETLPKAILRKQKQFCPEQVYEGGIQ